MNRYKIIWHIVRIGMLILIILVFTPLIIPKGKYAPELFHLPYTLWTGIIVYLGMVALTLLGIWVHSKLFREQ